MDETPVVEDAADADSKPPEAAKKEKLNVRFSELTNRITERDNRIKELETRLAAQRGADANEAPKPPVDAKPEAGEAEPDASKYDDYIAWQKDWIRWDRRQEQRAADTKAAQEREAAAVRQRVESWNERVQKATADHPDFAAVVNADTLTITPVMAQAIQDADIGTEVAYHLGKNPDVAARIAKLSPVAQVREIGKLEAALTPREDTNTSEDDDADAPEPQDTKPVSKAPKPIKPVSGGPAKTNPIRNIEGMSQAEYRAYREAGKL